MTDSHKQEHSSPIKLWYPKPNRSKSTFVVGFVSGAILFSGSAYAVNNYVSDNTAQNGYLLCANKSTKVVTFPNKLSCPSGTIALDLGAVMGEPGMDGVDGANGYNGLTGPAGPTGPAGTAKTYTRVTSPRDIVADGTYTTFTSLKKTIIAKISPSDAPLGAYALSAYVEGLWADNAVDGAYFACYFQDKKDFDLNKSARQRGGSSTQNGTWTGINQNPRGTAYFYATTDDPIYLVCASGGTVKDIDAYLIATSIDPAQLKNTSG